LDLGILEGFKSVYVQSKNDLRKNGIIIKTVMYARLKKGRREAFIKKLLHLSYIAEFWEFME
jgi:hypothetical protein